MELAFESKELREICQNEQEMVRQLGAALSEALKRRLSDLRAAPSVRDLPAGEPRIVDAGHSECMVINLDRMRRLVFAANHIKNPTAADGSVDWTRVSRIKILRIEEGHG